jgi:hypothetical protein
VGLSVEFYFDAFPIVVEEFSGIGFADSDAVGLTFPSCSGHYTKLSKSEPTPARSCEALMMPSSCPPAAWIVLPLLAASSGLEIGGVAQAAAELRVGRRACHRGRPPEGAS